MELPVFAKDSYNSSFIMARQLISSSLGDALRVQKVISQSHVVQKSEAKN